MGRVPWPEGHAFRLLLACNRCWSDDRARLCCSLAAQWLAANDKFDEARIAYREAGRPDRATRMLEQLTHNAVLESRYSDAAHYYFLLAMEVGPLALCSKLGHGDV